MTSPSASVRATEALARLLAAEADYLRETGWAKEPIRATDLDAVRKLAAEASPGPWLAEPIGQGDYHCDVLNGHRSLMATCQYSGMVGNAAFIAASRTLLPAMADEIEALRSKLAAAESAIENAYIASSTDYALHIARILDPVRADRFRLTGVSE